MNIFRLVIGLAFFFIGMNSLSTELTEPLGWFCAVLGIFIMLWSVRSFGTSSSLQSGSSADSTYHDSNGSDGGGE